MKIAELQPGDVLFTLLGQKVPALHTQIYSDDSHFPQTIIHAVDDPRRGGPSKLMATGLKTDGMLVYRCRNADLSYEAYATALRWAKYLVPYDQERKTLKEGYRNTIPSNVSEVPSNLVALMRLLFQGHGIFRAIKYTARRNEILCYPTDTEMSRGLTCTMFVILCYQAAALADKVLTTSQVCPGEKAVRISDKKMTSKELDEMDALAKTSQGGLDPVDVKAYKQYVGMLQSGNEYQIDWDLAGRDAPNRKPNPKLPGYKYVPSILCWKNPPSITSFDFAGAMTAGFMVDAKITTSEQLRVCLEEDKVGWLNKGFLDGSEKPDEDPEYKSKVQNYAEWAQNSRDRFNPIK